MACFIGQSGEFQKERAIKNRLNCLLLLYLLLASMFFVFGFVAAKVSLWWLGIAVVLVVPSYKILVRQSDKYLRMARCDEKGATGENEILPYLKNLPDAYTVVCDLDFADSYGNIDHLVIGPTGLFAIDVKNWRGTVIADGKGELLLNGQPTDKPQVKYFTRRVMDLRERLTALTKLEPYIQCVFVFPRTRVEAKWGTTGAVQCINMEQLSDHITKGKGGKAIAASDIPRLVSAAEALKNLAAKA